jgi:hypothetical protein
MQHPIPRWYALATMFVGFAVTLLLTLGYVNKVDKESDRQNERNDRKWCELLIAVDDAFQSAPTPASESGKRVAKAFHDRRVELGC